MVRSRRGVADGGFTLVEVVVAMGILLTLVSAVLGVLTKAAQTTQVDRRRIAASNLAAREIEVVRNAFRAGSTDDEQAASALAVAGAGDLINPDPLPGQPAGPLVVDGTGYTVTRQVNWLPLGTGTSACDGGAAVSYPGLSVRVSVTWPQMNGVSPVVSDTVLAPPKGVLASARAFGTVKVLDRNGQASPNRPVSFVGPSGTVVDQTGPDGCAVFPLSLAGTYRAVLSEAGYVAPDGSTTSTSANVSIGSGRVENVTMSYDRAAGLGVAYQVAGTTPDAGTYTLPPTLPGLTIANSNIQPVGIRTYAAGTTSVPTVFPWPEGYTMWAGTCLDADPAGSPSAGTRSVLAGQVPGQVDTVTLPVRALKVSGATSALQATFGLGTTPLGTVSVVATHSGSTCPGGDTMYALGNLTTQGSNQVLRSSLPPGVWAIQLQRGSATTSGKLVTLNQNGNQVVFP